MKRGHRAISRRQRLVAGNGRAEGLLSGSPVPKCQPDGAGTGSGPRAVESKLSCDVIVQQIRTATVVGILAGGLVQRVLRRPLISTKSVGSCGDGMQTVLARTARLGCQRCFNLAQRVVWTVIPVQERGKQSVSPTNRARMPRQLGKRS